MAQTRLHQNGKFSVLQIHLWDVLFLIRVSSEEITVGYALLSFLRSTWFILGALKKNKTKGIIIDDEQGEYSDSYGLSFMERTSKKGKIKECSIKWVGSFLEGMRFLDESL